MLRDDEDFFRRHKDRPAWPSVRQIRFFKTIAGPYADPYPAAGNVVYAELLRDPTFTQELGSEADFGTPTGTFAYIGVLSIPPEGTVIAAEKLGARWWALGITGSGGSCDTIRFQIVQASLVGGVMVALSVPLAVPVGFSVCDVPGLLIQPCSPGIAGLIEIYDPNGCYFNEPSNFFPGRQGWARYMEAIFPAPPDDLLYDAPQWEVFALCCNAGGCE
jgi:hypothetical protein